MKILFVDDEPMVLSAMERALFDTDWDIHCVTSGDEALAFLADNEVDFVVSDMRMPGKDGAELLEDVYNLYPDAVRIVLSGHADKDASSREGRMHFTRQFGIAGRHKLHIGIADR